MSDIPKTLREKLMLDREQLYAARASIFAARLDLIAGEQVTTYSIGNRSRTVTAANLKDLEDALASIDRSIEEIEAMLNGRAVRSTQTHSYVQPAAVWWLLR